MRLFLAIAMLSPSVPDANDDVTLVADTIRIITVSAPLKHDGDFREQPLSATTIDLDRPGSDLVTEPKNLSLTVPNMLHADYGSRMTGSIYMRGLGSRIDQPAVGLYVDNVPVLNKNNYDFDYFDIRRIDILRGPQGTLYGRNTIGGVIDVQTLSPFDYQGVRIGGGYGNGNSWHTEAAVYGKPTEKLGLSLAASHRATDGFFVNEYDGSDADRSRSSALRFKVQARLPGGWTMENSLYANLVRQNGFAYAPYDEQTGKASAINHNDPCTYNRFGLVDGLTFRYTGRQVRLSSTTSYQYTDDDMTLDQDFSPASLFTLRQSQREHAATQEFVARSPEGKRWQWLTGFFGFYRHLDSEAPVTFKRDGIDELILDNANAGIDMGFPPSEYPDVDLLIHEEQFPIDSYFTLPAFGLSLYHRSSLRAGRWNFTAGLRADYEHTAIRYSNFAALNYRFTLTMPEYKRLPVEMKGHYGKSYFEVMPSASVMYETAIGNLYASVARGYKAGGYNTQIFSDILQNRMMNTLMSDLGIYFGDTDTNGTDNIENAIYYEPERSWNYELGGHFNVLEGPSRGQLLVDAALFYIDCRNQQLTAFPPGNGIGRMMSNAGRTRSYGAEVSVDYRFVDFRLTGSYGYTNARFLAYNDGREDYSGNHVPYAPGNTVSLQGEYRLDLRGGDSNGSDGNRGSSSGNIRSRAGHLLFGLGVQGVGRIYWNETNTLSQPFYTMLNASIAWKTEHLQVSLWARNLTGTRYNTFYFKSVGRSFVQRGKPVQAGITLILTL